MTEDDVELVKAAIAVHDYNLPLVARTMRDECGWPLSKTRDVFRAVSMQASRDLETGQRQGPGPLRTGGGLRGLVRRSFERYLDARLLDLATEPGGFVDANDYRRWNGADGHQLEHLWTMRQVRDCAAASWQDACRDHAVQHSSEEWRGLRLELLRSWGVGDVRDVDPDGPRR